MKASDEAEVKARQVEQDLRRIQELEDVRAVLANQAGRRFLRRLFARGKIFETTFTGNSHGMFLEGHRNFALMILRDVCEADSSAIPDMMRPEEIEKGKSNGGSSDADE